MAGRAGGRPRLMVAAIVAAVSVVALAGCGGGAAVPTAPATTTAPARPSPSPSPRPAPPAVDPLRGTLTPAGATAHPSLAAKIDDHFEARPQIGLNAADIVFEELVEGGLTRYLVVWHSDVPAEIGPVRSVRPMDPDLITPFGGMIAYSGGQELFVAMMQAAPVVNLVFDYDDTGLFHRADDRPSPHDVILDAAEAMRRNAALPPPPPQFAYGTADPLDAPQFAPTPTSRIDLAFSEGSTRAWEWDAATSAWLRSQEGTPDVEASGERVRATNVVTLRVAIDGTYGEVPRTVAVGTGEAWVSSHGRTAHGTWSKEAADEPFTLRADDGTPMRLAPGSTWVELVPVAGSASFAP